MHKIDESVNFRHWKLIPEGLWRWPNFAPKEIASKGNASITIHFDSLDKLQAARTLADKPFYINSAYRDPEYNIKIKGAKDSQHMKGRAFDISLKNFDKDELREILQRAGFTGFGLHYDTFLHADTGPKRSW